MTCEIVPGPFQEYSDVIAMASCAILDPPYSRHVHEAAVRQSGELRNFGFRHLTPTLRRDLARALSVVKGWHLIYSDLESFWLWRMAEEAAGSRYYRAVPWTRFAHAQLSGDCPPAGCEIISMFRGAGAPRKHWNGPGAVIEFLDEPDYPGPDVLRHGAVRGRNGVDKFSAEKPLDQMLDLVSWFSDPGTLVVDLTAGSGTTIAACALLGRDGLGFEIDPGTAGMAAERTQDAESGDLDDRDGERVVRWVSKVETEAARIQPPKGEPGSKSWKLTVRTWERAQRRLADVERVRNKLDTCP